MKPQLHLAALALSGLLAAPLPAAALQFPASVPALGAQLQGAVSATHTAGGLRLSAVYALQSTTDGAVTEHFTFEFQPKSGGSSASISRYRRERRSADGALLSGLEANYVEGIARFLGQNSVRASGPLQPVPIAPASLTPEGRPTIDGIGDVFDFSPALDIRVRY